MHLLLLTLLLIALVYLPQWWVQSILNHYNRESEPFPGNGGELAQHLLKRFEVHGVKVEVTDQGDHYDPVQRVVRLTGDKLDGRTLTAIATAAHEVGHAIQHASDYPPFRWRERLVRFALISEQIGSFLLFSVPLIAAVTRLPAAGALMLLAALATIGVGVVVQLVTLPVEWDASFGKALPILTKGGYINPKQELAVRRILRACAMSYVAASLAGLLNFWRWMRILRR